MKVPFFRPQIGSEEISEVVDCLSNGWLTTGKKAALFEQKFAEYLGGEVEAVAVNSATAGMHLALEAIGIKEGDEVIVPDYTFTATAEVVRYLGADPVFVDIDYETLNVSPEKVKAAITPKTKAIMPVHFAGLACDMEPITDIADAHHIDVVEDAAHALPARRSGVRVGNFATSATVFSFYANKTMTTGEGGMLVTRNAAIADRARKMRLHGFDRDAFDRFKSGNWRYDVIAPGYKYNLTDIAAAIGLHQLKKVDDFQRERERIALRYLEGLAGLPLNLPACPPENDIHSWHLFIIRTRPDSPITRDELFTQLLEAGITCSVHYSPLHKFTYWRETYDLHASDFPESERSGNNVISLPMYPGMPEEETDYVMAVLREQLA